MASRGSCLALIGQAHGCSVLIGRTHRLLSRDNEKNMSPTLVTLKSPQHNRVSLVNNYSDLTTSVTSRYLSGRARTRQDNSSSTQAPLNTRTNQNQARTGTKQETRDDDTPLMIPPLARSTPPPPLPITPPPPTL